MIRGMSPVAERRAKGYCAACGAKGSRRAGRWARMRPQPDGSPHDHRYVPGPRPERSAR